MAYYPTNPVLAIPRAPWGAPRRRPLQGLDGIPADVQRMVDEGAVFDEEAYRAALADVSARRRELQRRIREEGERLKAETRRALPASSRAKLPSWFHYLKGDELEYAKSQCRKQRAQLRRGDDIRGLGVVRPPPRYSEKTYPDILNKLGVPYCHWMKAPSTWALDNLIRQRESLSLPRATDYVTRPPSPPPSPARPPGGSGGGLMAPPVPVSPPLPPGYGGGGGGLPARPPGGGGGLTAPPVPVSPPPPPPPAPSVVRPPSPPPAPPVARPSNGAGGGMPARPPPRMHVPPPPPPPARDTPPSSDQEQQGAGLSTGSVVLLVLAAGVVGYGGYRLLR